MQWGRIVQVRLWTIIGEANTGKSTTVKELAGLPATGAATFKYVPLSGGGLLNIYAKRMAWQENKKTPEQSVEEIKDKCGRLVGPKRHKPFYINVLSVLRFEAITHPDGTVCPSAYEYLRHWADAGWSIESLVLLSPGIGARDSYGTLGVPFVEVDSAALAIPDMVDRVRAHFGWV